jgi:hypothetical protein
MRHAHRLFRWDGAIRLAQNLRGCSLNFPGLPENIWEIMKTDGFV